MKEPKKTKEWKVSKYLKCTMKALVKARDLYIKSMTECSDKMMYATAVGCPTGQPISMPPPTYTFSKSTNDHDYRELVRIASLRQQQQIKQSHQNTRVPRCQSVGLGPVVVGFGTIDEDKPCENFDDVKFNAVYPRSRSQAAVTRRTNVFF